MPGDCRIDGDACPGVPACSGSLLRALHFSAQRVQIRALVASSDGQVAIGGYYEGTLDFGGASAPLPLASDHDGFVAAFDVDGQARWVHVFSGLGAQEVTGLGLLPDGTLIAQGANDPTLFDDFHFPLGDGFVAALDPAGNLRWSKVLASARVTPNDIAVDSHGRAILNGDFAGQFSLDGLQLSSGGEYQVAIDSAGTGIWARQSGSPGGGDSIQNVATIALDEHDNLLSVGVSGDDPPTFPGLRKVAPDGTVLFDQSFLASPYGYAFGVAADATGGILVTGAFTGGLTVGGTELHSGPMIGGAFAYDGWVAKFSPDGSNEWLHQYPNQGSAWGVEAQTAAADAYGNFLVAGSAGDSIIAGVRNRVPVDSLIVLKLRPDGSKVWLHSFQATGSVLTAGIATDASGHVWVAGYYDGALDLGDLSPMANLDDGFLIELAP
jgi:hypothetical protein